MTTWIEPWSRVLVIVQTTVWSESTGTSARLVPLPEATMVAPSLHSIELVYLSRFVPAGTGLGDRVVAGADVGRPRLAVEQHRLDRRAVDLQVELARVRGGSRSLTTWIEPGHACS